MKFACISLASALVICSISLAQTSRLPITTYSASALSNGVNLRAVEGAPFSADVVIQTTQVLADGTPVTRETRGKMFRDSAGRTRSETEMESAAGGAVVRSFVTIIDPMKGTSMVLDVATKSATVFHLTTAPAATANKVNLAVPTHAGRAGIKQLTPPGSEDLGAMMLEGFSVTGIRRTRAADAGAAKGAAPTIVTEAWFSKELNVDLLVSRRGPKSDSRLTRLTNITPGEPDPTIFQVPADYTVHDNSQVKGVTQ